MVERVSHFGICVSDAGRALRFYRDALGFREVSRLRAGGAPTATLLQLPGADVEAVFLERDGFRIELLHYFRPGTADAPTPRPMNAPGLTHLSLRVRDLDGAVAAVTEGGGRVLDATRVEIPQAKTRVAFVADPDGTLIELVEAPGDPALPPGAPPT